ncbi:MAG TPA: iron donor protein CyaY [Myxococcaceae bacterium]|jgi:CyaY protein|nr:iron donor protein CyaY [Myxococcaceae bacterium]
MDEARYNQLVAAAFQRLLLALDRVDPDLLDADSTGEMVTITSASGQKVVVNTQRAARQIWVAGKGLGVHFSYQDDGRWLDDKGKGLELFAFVADAVEAAAGVRLEFAG